MESLGLDGSITTLHHLSPRTFAQEVDGGQHRDVKLGILKIAKNDVQVEVRSECVETPDHFRVFGSRPALEATLYRRRFAKPYSLHEKSRKVMKSHEK